MSAEYSAKEVRAMAAEISDYGGTQAGLMLTAYANRIKADEGAVPVAHFIETSPGNWEQAASMYSGQPGVTPLFTHPPAQAAQVEDDKILWGIAANAGRVSIFRRPRWAHVIAATGQGSTSAAALCRRFGFDPEEITGGQLQPDLDDAPTAEPVAQGEVVTHRSRAITERGRFEYALKALVPSIYEEIRAEAYQRPTDDDDHAKFAAWAESLAAQPRAVPEGMCLVNVSQLEAIASCLRIDALRFSPEKLASVCIEGHEAIKALLAASTSKDEKS